MRKPWAIALGLGVTAGFAALALAQGATPPALNGVPFPEGYQDWRLISVSERTDNNTLRAILGNDVAIEAARAGNVNPWPDGAMLVKIVLNQGPDANWPAAVVPTAVRHVEVMVKNATEYADTGGWGYGRWLGPERAPFGDNADFDQACFACHTPIANRDYVFTTPIALP